MRKEFYIQIHQKIQRFLCISFACLILPNLVIAEKQQESWQNICEQVKNIPYPAADLPTAKDAKSLKGCISYNLYYGFVEKADPVKARLCAFGESKDLGDSPFYGKAMLMTIYANGVGAKRNFDLALRLACENGGAPAEIEARIKHIIELKAQNWLGNDFSLCDDITSGYMAGFCADHREKFKSIVRDKKLSVIQAKWTKADKKEFAALSKIAYQYFDVHADNEVDQSGTAHTALYIDDKALQEDFFIKTLEMLEKESLPKYSDQQFKDADAKLNSVYKQVQQRDDSEGGSVTKEGIKITQRTWIKYKDAFVKFCSKKYPDASKDIKTYITLNRIKELEEFIP